jgi:hypothetical protein
VNSLKQIIKRINWLKVTQVLLVTVLVFAPLVGFAQLNKGFQCDPSSGLNCSAGSNVNTLIRTVINWLLGIAFGVAVLFLIIGGFWYITSAGNEETAEKGKGTAVNAIIGIVIIILAYVIVNVIANLVGGAGGGGGV